MNTQMKRVIFVDDEPNVLDGLQRMLRPMRNDWDMHFLPSGEEALVDISSRPCDVIVSDMRMPGMDGAQLLSHVREVCPNAIRIALSGQTATNMIYRCIESAHQYLAKPCAAEQLISAINRAFELQRMLSNEGLKTLMAHLSRLPSLPSAYKQIVAEIQSENASLQKIGSIVETDIAMTVRVLQLVNSSYFGLPRRVA